MARCFSAARRNIRASLQYLTPLLDERKAKIEAYGDDYPEKPVRFYWTSRLFVHGVSSPLPQNDMLQWLLEEEINRKGDDLDVTRRVLLVNFTAIHTSSTVSLSTFVLSSLSVDRGDLYRASSKFYTT